MSKENRLTLFKDFSLGPKAVVFDSLKTMDRQPQSFSMMMTTTRTIDQSCWEELYPT